MSKFDSYEVPYTCQTGKAYRIAHVLLYCDSGNSFEGATRILHSFLRKSNGESRLTFSRALHGEIYDLLRKESAKTATAPKALSLALRATELLENERDSLAHRNFCSGVPRFCVRSDIKAALPHLRECCTEEELHDLWKKIQLLMADEDDLYVSACHDEIQNEVESWLVEEQKKIPFDGHQLTRAIALSEFLSEMKSSYELFQISAFMGALYILRPKELPEMLAHREFLSEELLRLYGSLPAAEYAKFTEHLPTSVAEIAPAPSEHPKSLLDNLSGRKDG